MTTLDFLEKEEKCSQFGLKLGSAGFSAFSDKPEAELELCTILTNFSGQFILQLLYLPAEVMFQGSSKLLTELSFEIHWFEISRLGKIFSDLSEQEVSTSRFKFKKDFSTFLDFSEEKIA